jgi:putative heme-binding domain-containing protein
MMRTRYRSCNCGLLFLALLAVATGSMAAGTKKIVLIAGKKSHGPVGNGIHDYPWSVKLIKVMLDNSNVAEQVRVEYHLDGWPHDEKTLDDADAIMVISDGRDGELFEEAPHFSSPAHRHVIARQMRRGCGFLTFHFSTFAPDAFARDILDWSGGYFDWETNGQRKWYSAITTQQADVLPATPGHPILRGVDRFSMREEFYYNIRFEPSDRSLVPIWTVPALRGRLDKGNVVAWARERADGGRGFGTTCGHFYDNWKQDNFRRMVLNAIAWAAKVDVPASGIAARFYTHAEITAALASVEGTQRAVVDDRPIRALLFAGNEAHKWHNWERTTPAIKAALERDPRIRVDISHDIEDFGRKRFAEYDLIVQNYCNWNDPRGLSESAKKAFVNYLQAGGGLLLLHFANGAFHYSLPTAGQSDWPEYRKIARRVWNHQGDEHTRSGHDLFGSFRVDIATIRDPITEGLAAFTVNDELYFRQAGSEPIEPLITARSKVTGKDEPLAWTYRYGRGRVFQTLLGHSEQAYDAFETREMLRRAAAWVAGRSIRRLVPEQDRPQQDRPQRAESATRALTRPMDWLAEGRFGKALDARVRPAIVAGRSDFRQRPLSAECWVKLIGKANYNILIACDPKASADHWELFTFAGSGELALYAPGWQPDHVRTGIDLCDGRWHHVTLNLQPNRVRLSIDGKQAADATTERIRNDGVAGDVAIGSLVERGLGCDGLIDDVRISRGTREIRGLPLKPAEPDAQTIGLWSFDRVSEGASPDQSPWHTPAHFAEEQSPTRPLQGVTPRKGVNLAPVDSRLKAVLIDRSENDAFLAVRVDSQGHVFVGGREAVFVFEPDDRGGYRPKRKILSLPPDSIVIGLEFRGEDLYVLSNNALYLVPGGRVRREGLDPRRILWGIPLDYHISFHCMAWGPEGDLYLDHGDPLLNYGDFSRPDHWGHWTLYAGPKGEKFPYTGVGSVLRVKPDGSSPRIVATGLRGPVGLAFDANWNLFTNDNDHESMADRYAPARLLHVSPHIDFAWPRGWMASKSPDRTDLIEPMLDTLGRGVPCDLVYYDDEHLPSEYRRSLLMCRWDRSAVYQYPIRQRGATYATEEKLFLAGKGNSRPVGIGIGRGGRVFVTSLYLAGNVGSPYCPSDLVMITRADDHSDDDHSDHRFEPLDLTTISNNKLWSELSQSNWQRRHQAHTEITRRGPALIAESEHRLATSSPNRPEFVSLMRLSALRLSAMQLSASTGTRDAIDRLTSLTRHAMANVRLQAIEALSEHGDRVPADLFGHALSDADPRIQLAALNAWFDLREMPPWESIVRLAASGDTYLRQTAMKLMAKRATGAEIAAFAQAPRDPVRVAAVVAAGFRLTVPASDFVPPASVALKYTSANAFFTLHYADAPQEINLRSLGRVGSYTTAEWWANVNRTAEQNALFAILIAALDDPAPSVQTQAIYFLELLRDPRSEPLIAKTRLRLIETRLGHAATRPIDALWTIGPFDDRDGLLSRTHPPEEATVDLAARYPLASRPCSWEPIHAIDGHFDFHSRFPLVGRASVYGYLQLSSASRQTVLLEIDSGQTLRVLHNGHRLFERTAGAKTGVAAHVILDVQPGSNDLLIRLAAQDGFRPLKLAIRARQPVAVSLPDKLDSAELRTRLQQASAGTRQSIPREFASIDWPLEISKANAAEGRRLFGAVGCSKCHAIAQEQKGGGGPSLAEARKRFTIAHVVESILLPSRQIAEPFRGTTIVTTQGQVLTGLIVAESPIEIELLLPDASRKTVRMNEIEERRRCELSPMPQGLVKTPHELRDLVAYLLSENPLPP